MQVNRRKRYTLYGSGWFGFRYTERSLCLLVVGSSSRESRGRQRNSFPQNWGRHEYPDGLRRSFDERCDLRKPCGALLSAATRYGRIDASHDIVDATQTEDTFLPE